MFLRIAGSKYFAIYFLHFLRIVSIRLRQFFLDLIFDLSFWKIGLFHKFSTLFLHWDNFKYWDYFLYWDYFVYWDYFLDWDYFMYWDYFGRDYFLYWDYFLFWDYLDMGLFWSGLFWAGLLWAGLFWSGLFQHPAILMYQKVMPWWISIICLQMRSGYYLRKYIWQLTFYIIAFWSYNLQRET